MRIFLSIVFLLFSTIVAAQKPVESVIAIKTPGSKFQFVNRQTRVAVDNLVWDETEPFVSGFAKVYVDNKCSFVNANGKLIAPVEFENARNFVNELAAVRNGGKWGFINGSGKLVIPFIYSIIFDFEEPNITTAFENKNWWLLNNKGVIIKQLDITVCYGFKNGTAKVAKADKEGILYPNGKIVFTQALSSLKKPIPWHPNLNNLAVPCPDNIGFEFGDLTNWECFAGDVDTVAGANVITVSPSPPTIGRHTIYSRLIPGALDQYGLFDTNPPDGSNFAVKLGNDANGAEAERIRYTIHVPLNDSTFSIKYDYAVVFEDPGHRPWEQPRFVSRLIDSATNTAVGCASLEYIATSGLPGFKVSTVDPGVIYKPWASVFYSLRGYAGQTLYLEFTTADCALGGHWGYAYVDVESTCGSPVEIHYECLAPNETTLTAPPGFQFYNWWNSNYTILLGTGQQLNLNPGPPIGTIIWVELVPFNSFGCQDTLLVNLNGSFDAEFDMTDPIGCAPQTYTFYSRNIPSSTTLWDFGDGNTATGDTVTHTYPFPGNYNVTFNVTMPGGCTGSAIRLITIYPMPDMVKPTDQTFCNDALTSDIIFTGTPPGLVFNWTNSDPSIGLPAAGSGNILSFFAINTGGTPVTATITVTPAHLTCSGSPKVFTITVNPSPNVVQPGDQTLCNGATTNAVALTGSVSGTVFNWTNSNPSIGLPASGSGDIPAFTAVNTSNAIVVGTIIIVPSNGICPGLDRFFRIFVNPTPNVVQPSNLAACNNVATGAINFSGAVSGTSFSWTNNNTSIGLPAAGTGNIPSFIPVNIGTVPITAIITVIPSANGCPGPSQNFTITVNPTPNVVQPTSQSICNAAATNAVNFTGAVSGTGFSWTNNDPSIGLAASGTGDIPSFIATNITNAPVTATITVTPSANGCPGAAQSFTITVNPTPNVVLPASQVLCNAALTNAINFTGTVSGTNFLWTNNEPSIGLAASGSGNIPSFTAINITNAPITAIIAVAPFANGCTGVAGSFTITVNPTPNVVQPANQVLCNAAATNAVNFAGAVSGTIYNWTNDNTSIGLAASGTGDIPSFTATNITNAPVTATITVTPSANGCTGAIQSFTITVNPTPNVVVPANQVLCNNAATNAINFTGTVSGTNFLWTNNDPSIGLAASGSGDIPSFTAINITNEPIKAIIAVAPFANGCVGVAGSFTITVNPTPNVVQPANQVLCNAAATNAVNFAGAVSGTIYNWTNDNTSIGLLASGNGDIPSFTATNITNAPVTATIRVTPSANGCTGAVQSFTIIVNPTPNVVQPANQVLCNNATTNAINFTGAVSGSSFNWTNSNTSIGLAASGTGNIAAFAAINVTNAPLIATIIVTPSANACTGAAQSFTITVNPTPNVVQPASQVVCNNAATNDVHFTGAVSGSGFSWTNDKTSIGLAAGGTGDILSFTAINVTNVAVTATITVAPSASSCPGSSQSFTITVNPTPNVVQPADQRLCDGFTTNAIIFSGNVAGTSFNWTNSTSSIGLASSGTGNIAAFNAVNNGSAPVNATVIVTPLAKGCAGLARTATIIVDPNPKIDLGTDLTLSTGTITNLNSVIQNGPIINWAWTPATGLSCTDCPSPVLTVTNDITYNVSITNIYGCIARDIISIFTFCKNSQVFVPNAFTPDGDGLNDILMVRGKGIFVTSFRIFNRWGELVFQKTNFNPNDKQYGWDGRVRGIPATTDVFIFTAEIICDNGIKYTYKGNTTLLK
jgi:gliding motility-associated-like protein